MTAAPIGVPIEFSAAPTQQAADRIRGLDDIPNIQTMEIPPIDYLVPGLISRSTITLWTGADGTAKTYLAQRMAIAVATGGEFLGRRCQQAEVLYLDYENPSFAIRDRLDLMTGGTVIPNLHVWGTWLEQDPPQIGSELLLTIAKESRPLIVVDPFRYSHSAEENDSTEMSAVMQQLGYCKKQGCAVVILHHPAKSEGSTGRGSSCIKGAADVAFLQEMADPNEGGLITLKCIKHRFGETLPITIRPNFDEGTFEVTDSPQFTKRTSDTEKLLQIITQTPGLSQNSWWKQSGMMKARFVALVKENNGTLWREERSGSSLRYISLVLKTQNNSENNRTGRGELFVSHCSQRRTGDFIENKDFTSCSPVLSPKGENREQLGLEQVSCSRTGAEKPNGKPSLGRFANLPEPLGTTEPLLAEKPNGKTNFSGLPACPSCGSTVVREPSGLMVCQTCHAGLGAGTA